MKRIYNLPESFFREIRQVQIFPSESLKMESRGLLPDAASMLYNFDVVPESFARTISTKKQNGNYYYDVDISFPFLQMDHDLIQELYQAFGRKSFAIVLISNTELLVLGNDREPLTIDFIDNKKDDNSGNDDYTLSITGQTIFPPVPAGL